MDTSSILTLFTQLIVSFVGTIFILPCVARLIFHYLLSNVAFNIFIFHLCRPVSARLNQHFWVPDKNPYETQQTEQNFVDKVHSPHGSNIWDFSIILIHLTTNTK